MKLFGKIVASEPDAVASAVRTTDLARDKRGNVVAICAAAMPMIVGAMGLGVDFTQWVLWKRSLQAAADSAAFSGAQVLKAGGTDTYDDEATKIINHNNSETYIPRTLTQIRRVAADGTTPDANGTNVEVTLRASGPLYFAGLFMTSSPTIEVRSVAGPLQGGLACFVSLEETAAWAMQIKDATVTSSTCGFHSNSGHAQAFRVDGNGTTTALYASARGSVSEENNELGSTPKRNNAGRVPDPFGVNGRNIQLPNVRSGGAFNRVNFNTSSGTRNPSPTGQCYNVPDGGELLIQDVNIVLNRGVYIFCGSGILKLNGTARLDGTAGVSIVLTGGARLESNGDVDMDIDAMTTAEAAAAYSGDAERRALAGIVFWQHELSIPNDKENFITGNTRNTIGGAIYAPHGRFVLKGNSGVGVGTQACMQLVAKTIFVEGNVVMENNCPAGDANYSAFITSGDVVLKG